MGHIIRCQKISSLQPEQMKKRTSNDEVELTVVPGSEKTIKISSIQGDANSVPPSKKVKIEGATSKNVENDKHFPLQVLKKDSVRMKEEDYEEADEDDDDFDDDDDDDDDDMNDYVYSTNSSRNVRRTYDKDDSNDYVSPISYRAKNPMSQSPEKRKVKPKLFRSEWLDIDIFRDWLDRDPTNPYKARCVACDSVMNAGKSELEKHAAGAKHTRAVERMQQHIMLNHVVVAEEGEDSNEEIRHMDDASEHTANQPIILGDEMSSDLYQIREQHIEALNRIATAVESLSSTTVTVLEKMSSNQDILVKILQQMQKK